MANHLQNDVRPFTLEANATRGTAGRAMPGQLNSKSATNRDGAPQGGGVCAARAVFSGRPTCFFLVELAFAGLLLLL